MFKHEKYHILNEKFYQPVKSSDKKVYICKTCHRHLNKNVISSQKIVDKIALDHITDKLKD